MHSSTRLLAGSGLALLLAVTAVVSAGPATSAVTTPACRTRDLAASISTAGGGTAGSLYVQLFLRNVSGRTCHTGGFPGVSYVGYGNGTQIGAPAVWIDRSQVRTLVVRPGGRVVATLREVNAFNYSPAACLPHATDGLRVYPPNQTLAKFVVQRTTGCRNRAVHLLSVTPFRAA